MLAGTSEYAAFCHRPEYGTVIRLLALDGSGVKKTFQLPPFFHYHWTNTFEAEHPDLGPCVCLEAFFAKDPRSVNMFDLDVVKDPSSNMDSGMLQYADHCPCALKLKPLPTVASDLQHQHPLPVGLGARCWISGPVLYNLCV